MQLLRSPPFSPWCVILTEYLVLPRAPLLVTFLPKILGILTTWVKKTILTIMYSHELFDAVKSSLWEVRFEPAWATKVKLLIFCLCLFVLLTIDPSWERIFTARKWSFGQGNIFTPVCHVSFCSQGVCVSQHASQVKWSGVYIQGVWIRGACKIHRILRNTVKKRAVRVLLQCFLVALVFKNKNSEISLRRY